MRIREVALTCGSTDYILCFKSAGGLAREEIERNVRERDKADMSRAISPLRQADDAVVLDNSCMTVEQQMAWFMTELERINK